MSEPIVTRQEIARNADRAACAFSAGAQWASTNPYPVGSDAAAAWKASFERYLLLHSVPEGEASA